MMQYKHKLSFNPGLNLNLIGKFWNKKDKITQSINNGSYVSPRFKKSGLDDVELF